MLFLLFFYILFLYQLYQALFICKRLTADDDAWLGLVKNFTFSYKRADFSLIVTFQSKHYDVMLFIHFSIFYIFHFFQIIMVSLFLAQQVPYFIMFKESNVFKFTNFPFKTK